MMSMCNGVSGGSACTPTVCGPQRQNESTKIILDIFMKSSFLIGEPCDVCRIRHAVKRGLHPGVRSPHVTSLRPQRSRRPHGDESPVEHPPGHDTVGR